MGRFFEAIVMRERCLQGETERSVLWRLITGMIPFARYHDLLVAAGFADTQADGSNDFVDSQIPENNLELGRFLSAPPADVGNNADESVGLCARIALGAAAAVRGRKKKLQSSGKQSTTKRKRLGEITASEQEGGNPARLDQLVLQSYMKDWIALLRDLTNFIEQHEVLDLNGDKQLSKICTHYLSLI